jgi:prolyl oligopeptidase
MKITPPARLALTTFLLTLAALAQTPPATPKRPVTDEYQGVKVSDDYRWLENWEDAEVKQWSAAQNARSREYLDHLPARPAIRQRLKQALSASSAAYYGLEYRGGTLFAMKYQPPQQQPMLVALSSADDPAGARVIFDPNVSSAKGSIAVDFYVPSLDGNSLPRASENGSEDSSAHVFEVATGKDLSDVVPRVNFATAGGSLEWKADSSGFYYTRYPRGNERPPEDANFYQQVYFHRMGSDTRQDTYVIGKEFPRIAEIQLHASEDGQWLIAAVANGDGGEFAHYVMDAAGHWTQVTHFADGIVAVKPGPDGALYLLSRKDAPRGQILRLPLAHLDLAQARVIVPESSGSAADESARASIEEFAPAPGHLYVTDVVGGPSRIRVFDLEGHPLPAPPLPPVSAVYQIEPTRGGDVIFGVSTYLEPSAWYRFDAATGKSPARRVSRLHRSFRRHRVSVSLGVKDGTLSGEYIRRRENSTGPIPHCRRLRRLQRRMKPYFLGAFTRTCATRAGFTHREFGAGMAKNAPGGD